MKRLEWDYSTLADSYSQRPNYADAAIDGLLEAAGMGGGDPALDVGAGTGHLTLKLAARDLKVTALEPNPQMRAIGVSRTMRLANVKWHDALMQQTGLPDASFKLVTYGSSFGVAGYEETLREAHRLLRRGGVMASLFNHRDLDDPLQQQIEDLIHREIPGYEYGNRRRDQTAFIATSGLFDRVRQIETPFIHEQNRETWVAAWSSHATLMRQAGDRFPAILKGIDDLVRRHTAGTVRVPYTTRVWIGMRA
jgi:ubiquinone/menaquinone biosynthesis C-methylase UbiE